MLTGTPFGLRNRDTSEAKALRFKLQFKFLQIEKVNAGVRSLSGRELEGRCGEQNGGG